MRELYTKQDIEALYYEHNMMGFICKSDSDAQLIADILTLMQKNELTISHARNLLADLNKIIELNTRI